MLQVLFVAENPDELGSMQSLLRAYRREWDMSFCEGGPEAIACLAEHKYDVVASDLKMSGMDGAELLQYVKELYPESVRLLLCSQSESSDLFQSVGQAHQCLSKPCDPEVLRSAVTRACLLNKRLSNEGLRKLVSKIDALPSLPTVYLKLIDELRSDDASVDRIGELIAKDIGMTAKVLQLVNSSYFGLPVHVKDANHAAALLGVNTLRPLVLIAGVFRQLERSRVSPKLLEQVMEHSFCVGCLAKRLAEAEGMDREASDNAMLAGILHDVGKLILAENLGRDYELVSAAAQYTHLPLQIAELDQFDTCHAEVGGHLAAMWGLPQDILEAIAYHHDPDSFPDEEFSIITAVHVADALVNEAQAAQEVNEEETEADETTQKSKLDLNYLRQLGCDGRVESWRELVGQSGVGV